MRRKGVVVAPKNLILKSSYQNFVARRQVPAEPGSKNATNLNNIPENSR